jgi:ectoine hydroxylase-related dioxygenase (phytanoyl-CoA dioxygenase family)
MRLDFKALQELEELGFTRVEKLFSAQEVLEVDEAISAHHARTLAWLKEAPERGGISRDNEIAFTCHIAEKEPRLREFCLHPELTQIAVQLLGPDIDLYWNQSVYKQPETPREFPWHQDDAYTPVTPSPYLTLWLALNDATPQNGCIAVLPGWHKRGFLPHQESQLGLVCHSASDPEQGVLVPVNQGSLAVFWSLTPHKSGPNLSDGPRKAYVIQYCRAGLRSKLTGELVPGLIAVARNGRSLRELQGPVSASA